MQEPDELSESGNPVYRYKPREKPFEPVTGDAAHIELVASHIAKHIGEPSLVFHELVSDLVHIDVHLVPPRPERDFYTLVTSGMSAKSMKAPEGMEEMAYAELLICLPPDWPLKQADFKDENNYWPVRLLKMLARFPHEYDSWLSFAHTLPNGDPPEPYAPATKFCCAMLAPPVLAPQDFFELKISSEMSIHFFAILPLYPEEVELKLRKGADELFDRFDKHQISELVDVNRKNVARKLFGLF
jgi:hypothetical protein